METTMMLPHSNSFFSSFPHGPYGSAPYPIPSTNKLPTNSTDFCSYLALTRSFNQIANSNFFRQLSPPPNNSKFNYTTHQFNTLLQGQSVNASPPHLRLPQRPTTQLPTGIIPSVEEKIEVTMENESLWKKFKNCTTEMVITKSGRRLFPNFKIRMRGLDPRVQYSIMLEVVGVDDRRYKYHGSRWLVAGKADPDTPRRLYVHPESPAPGDHWLQKTISFHRLKLTNNIMDRNGHIILNSMHKYIPRIHVVRCDDPLRADSWRTVFSTSFPVAEFMAVTAYQNEKITQLKIENNPFAKGFRDEGAGRKNKRQPGMSLSRNEGTAMGSPDSSTRASSVDMESVQGDMDDYEDEQSFESPDYTDVPTSTNMFDDPINKSLYSQQDSSLDTENELRPEIGSPEVTSTHNSTPVQLNSNLSTCSNLKSKPRSFMIDDILEQNLPAKMKRLDF